MSTREKKYISNLLNRHFGIYAAETWSVRPNHEFILLATSYINSLKHGAGVLICSWVSHGDLIRKRCCKVSTLHHLFQRANWVFVLWANLITAAPSACTVFNVIEFSHPAVMLYNVNNCCTKYCLDINQNASPDCLCMWIITGFCEFCIASW